MALGLETGRPLRELWEMSLVEAVMLGSAVEERFRQSASVVALGVASLFDEKIAALLSQGQSSAGYIQRSAVTRPGPVAMAVMPTPAKSQEPPKLWQGKGKTRHATDWPSLPSDHKARMKDLINQFYTRPDA